jgi:D-serine deaminase-like pyridoxal phosphate-dependent protein
MDGTILHGWTTHLSNGGAPMTTRIDALDTPFAAIDLDIVERNLERAQRYFDGHDLALRPHIKTHKIPEMARRQVELGARGITCQKIGEAEVMADAGIADILLTFNIVGAIKLRRLVDLASRTSLAVVADSRDVAAGPSAAMAEAGLTLTVLVECDTGLKRCGVQTPEQAALLAREIDRLPGLAFGGLMTYPPRAQIGVTRHWLGDAVAAIRAMQLEVPVVSVGGTPDMYRAHEIDVSTEHRPGTYIYSDRYMAAHGVGTLADCALRIVATVVSRPTADRAIIDAGSKSFSADPMGLEGYGAVLEHPDADLAQLSEEHGHLDLSRCRDKPSIGDRLTIIPNHACAVSNLHDRIHGLQGDRLERIFEVKARGRVQ